MSDVIIYTGNTIKYYWNKYNIICTKYKKTPVALIYTILGEDTYEYTEEDTYEDIEEDTNKIDKFLSLFKQELLYIVDGENNIQITVRVVRALIPAIIVTITPSVCVIPYLMNRKEDLSPLESTLKRKLAPVCAVIRMYLQTYSDAICLITLGETHNHK